MQLIKGLFIAAVLCMATVSAGNYEQQHDEKGQYEIDSGSSDKGGKGDKGDSNDAVQKGFNVQQVNFADSDPAEEKGEEKKSSAVPLIAAVGACACIGVLGAVYLKRRKDDDKLPGEIFTIDDKNSVL
ncbi:uncharacterized protein IUM83_11668 [Phytophthora cinnamomi]|uniref:uncharacterized protein n=1 Tax=Phytophthora cinnamomi TaxID=4785 RepID=UPI0035598C43|nr:hypothetical protein IUM83_11668 [Phytophthora cinnamomi]